MSLTLKKSLGQHFLINEAVCLDIVEAVMNDHPARLLEIGPGGGAITKYFVKYPELTFKVVEIDQEKVTYLSKQFPGLKNSIIHESILTLNELPFDRNFYVVGNFPYNISTEILFKLIEWHPQIDGIVGMFQKEVALRVAANPGSKVYGVTSVLLQCFYTIEYLFDVQEQDFKPPPHVKSGVIKLKPKAVLPNFVSYKKMNLLVKTAFSQRRKTLRNATKSLFETDVLNDCIFDKRAEQLSLEDFASLTHKMN